MEYQNQEESQAFPKEQAPNNKALYVKLPIFLALALVMGILIGATMFSNNKGYVDILKGHEKIKEILTYINRDYVDTVNTEELIDYSIEKMLEKLDPHTVYIPAKRVEMANSQLEGDFDGIGIEFNIFQDTIYVVAPISGGPSEAVGLQSGDKIVKVDGEDVAGIGIDNMGVFKRLRGKKGSEVEVGIVRRGKKEIMYFTITRDKIPSYSVDVSYMVDAQTGYIKVSRFSETTYKEFREAMLKLKEEGMTQLILDLRDNPGGYMDRAVNMVDEMLAGEAMIVYTDGKGNKYDSEVKAHIRGIFEKGAVIVLINEGSASASEIVAGALQDNDRALIVGRRSFGKGLVQMPIKLEDGSQLRLTISRYYTPSGRCIQKSYESKEDYQKDLLARYEHGEFFSADSIKFDESLKYKTKKGRIVYGGGGIMPDYFIPLDTNINMSYLNDLYNVNLIREYALKYYKENEKALSAMSYEKYKSSFQVSDAMLLELQKMAKGAGVKFDEAAYNESKSLIKSHLKAWIARSTWGSEGFYPIWLENDDIFTKAIELFGEAKKLTKGGTN